jgi:tRNA pseudouridine38-40 synthase
MTEQWQEEMIWMHLLKNIIFIQFIFLVYKAFAYRHKGYVILYFEANAFLRSQIRMMAGSVLKVNRGRMSLEQLQEQVERKARHNTHLAPAAGLYLSKIIY